MFNIIKSKIFFIVIFNVLLDICSGATVKNPIWLRHLTRYIKRDSSIYQVMFLINEDPREFDHRIEDIIKSFTSQFSTIQTSFQETTREMAQNLGLVPSFSDPKTTLFAIDQFSKSKGINEKLNSSELNDAINFITELSQARSRPKCLIITQEEENATVKGFLQRMWSMRFLDVTILELVQRKSSKETSFLNFEQENVMMHFYIPFSNQHIKKGFDRKIEWFPNKLLHLHGYQLKVGMFHYPPQVTIIRNKTGHIKEIKGPVIEKVKALSKAMDFKIQNVISKNKNWDSISCDYQKSKGLIRQIITNKIQFIILQAVKAQRCDEKFFEMITDNRLIKFSMLIPILPNEKVLLKVEWKFLNAVILMTPLVLLLIGSRLLRFDPQNWRLTYLFQMVLGFSVPREPRNLVERIVFGSILVSALLHSTFIYTAFTSINIKDKSHLEIKTIDDVISSNMQVFISWNKFQLIFSNSDGKLKRLLNKGHLMNISTEKCLDRLIKFKNVTCLKEETRAKLLIQKLNLKYPKSVVKILDEPVQTLVSGLLAEKGSPYTKRIHTVLLKFDESGLYKKWDTMHQFQSNNEIERNVYYNTTTSESSLIKKQTLYTLLMGYVFSFLAFIWEIITYFYHLHH